MSDPVLAERTAYRELELVVRRLTDELATFRRRALTAEARLRELEGRDPGADDATSALARAAELEQENVELNRKLDAASERAKQMLDRVRFLRQQAGGGAER